MHSNSVDWFLYDRDSRHERLNDFLFRQKSIHFQITMKYYKYNTTLTISCPLTFINAGSMVPNFSFCDRHFNKFKRSTEKGTRDEILITKFPWRFKTIFETNELMKKTNEGID